MIQSYAYRFLFFLIMLIPLMGLTSCDSESPTLMKSSKQFDSDEKRDNHIAYMRKNHMDVLKHKRDETMYRGIRTDDHSLKGCINCHVPLRYQGKVLRHTNPEHFCTTCHTYVAAQLNCFECHLDHPVKSSDEPPSYNGKMVLDINSFDVTKLTKKQLFDLAFFYSQSKQLKSGGVSINQLNHSHLTKNNDIKLNNDGGASE